jgi:carboxylesterase
MKTTACVLIHGFGGDISELEYLEKYLSNEKIFDVHTIALAGHGGTQNELFNTNQYDWICSATTKIDELSYKYSNIIVIGFSMGGLIGAQLAAEKLIDTLILINTPFYVGNIQKIIEDMLNFDIDRYTLAISKTSIKSCFDFFKILENTKKILNKVECPTLIIQCSEDETVLPKSADEIEKLINGPVELKKYSGGRHQVFAEKDCSDLKDEICQDIIKWVNLSVKLNSIDVIHPKLNKTADPNNKKVKELLELLPPDRIIRKYEGDLVDKFWTNIFDRSGWRLQRNWVTDNYRIIEPDGIRFCDSYFHADTDALVKKIYFALFENAAMM